MGKSVTFVGLIFLVIAFLCLLIYVIQLVWNFVMPQLFHSPHISYLQATCLWALTQLLTNKGGVSSSK